MLSWVFPAFCFVYRRFAAKCGFSSFFAFFLRNTLVLKRIGAVSPFSCSFPLFPPSFPLLVALCGCFALFSFASHSFCRFPVELSALCAIMRILLFLELFSFVFLCKAVFRRYSFFPLLVSAICNATRVFSGLSEVFSLLRRAFPLSTDFCVSQRIFLAFRRLACSFRCSCGYGALIAVLRLIPRYFAVLAASCAFSLYFRRISAVLRIFPIAGIYQTFSPHKSLFHADIDAFSSIRSLLSRSAALLPCTALSHAVFCFPGLLAYDCRRKTASIPFRVPL